MSTAPCTKLNFSNAVHRTSPPPYYPGLLYGVENVEMYRPGGFHLVRIGDVFCSGRYKVLHKLGHGGTSTVWLARDQSRAVERTPGSGPLVSLKIMSAEKSREYETQNADFYISNALRKRYEASHHPGGAICRFFWDQFAHEGPNGSHLCLVSEFTGPSLGTVGSWGPSAEFRRLQVDVGKKVAAQVALAVEFLHSAGVVHGGSSSICVLCFMNGTDVAVSEQTLRRPTSCFGSPMRYSDGLTMMSMRTSVLAALTISRQRTALFTWFHTLVHSASPAGGFFWTTSL